MRAGLEVDRRGGYPHFAAYYTAHLGWLARLRGDDEQAVALGRQAVDIAERHEHAWWQAVTCALLGSTLLLTGDRPAAIGLFERGLAAAQDAGAEAYLLAARPGSPPPPARPPCSPMPTGCLSRPISRRTARGCSGRTPISPWRRPGWTAASRNAAGRHSLRCSRWPSGCRGRRRWPRRSPPTRAPSSGWASGSGRGRSCCGPSGWPPLMAWRHVREEARQAMRYLGGLSSSSARHAAARAAPSVSTGR